MHYLLYEIITVTGATAVFMPSSGGSMSVLSVCTFAHSASKGSDGIDRQPGQPSIDWVSGEGRAGKVKSEAMSLYKPIGQSIQFP